MKHTTDKEKALDFHADFQTGMLGIEECSHDTEALIPALIPVQTSWLQF